MQATPEGSQGKAKDGNLDVVKTAERSSAVPDAGIIQKFLSLF